MKKEFREAIGKQLEISPAVSYLSQAPDITEETQTTATGEIKQLKINIDGKPAQAKATKQAKENKTARLGVSVTPEQKRKVEGLAIIQNVSVSELLGRFIDDGLNRHKEELNKWEQIKELIHHGN